MKTATLLAAVAVLLLAPARGNAQQVNLEIKDGLVTLNAQNVPVQQILAEWARVGGAKVVNGEKIPGAPVTLRLTAVPERAALDTILRGVSGYMLAPRPAGPTGVVSGVSAFDRVLILPASAAPRGGPAPTNAAYPGGGRQQQAPAISAEELAEAEALEDTDNDEPEPVDDEGGAEVVQPQPGMNQRFNRRPGFPNPMAQPVPGDQEPVEVEGAPNQQSPTPGYPFGMPAGASTTPGVVTPVPQQPQDQQQDQQPQPGVRPPRPPL